MGNYTLCTSSIFNTYRTGLLPARCATALHEAAHAVVAMALGHNVTEVRIWNTLGNSKYAWEGVATWTPGWGSDAIDPLTEATHSAFITVAPVAAKAFASGQIAMHEFDGTRYGDRRKLQTVHEAYWADVSFGEFERTFIGEAKQMLDPHRYTLVRLAECLAITEQLDETAINGIAGELATRWQYAWDTDEDEDETPPVPAAKPTPATRTTVTAQQLEALTKIGNAVRSGTLLQLCGHDEAKAENVYRGWIKLARSQGVDPSTELSSRPRGDGFHRPAWMEYSAGRPALEYSAAMPLVAAGRDRFVVDDAA